jgi:hypothetical protein
VLHHAGKPKEGHEADARTLARGSSAIFDACGCVLNFIAGKSGADPKRIQQVKTPAEAEGAPIDPFELVVSDVAIDGNALAGVRVSWQPLIPVDPAVAARTAYERDAARLLKCIRGNQGANSNTLALHSGLGRNRALAMLQALADEGRITVIDGPRRSRFYRTTEGT